MVVAKSAAMDSSRVSTSSLKNEKDLPRDLSLSPSSYFPVTSAPSVSAPSSSLPLDSNFDKLMKGVKSAKDGIKVAEDETEVAQTSDTDVDLTWTGADTAAMMLLDDLTSDIHESIPPIVREIPVENTKSKYVGVSYKEDWGLELPWSAHCGPSGERKERLVRYHRERLVLQRLIHLQVASYRGFRTAALAASFRQKMVSQC
jgi:hypothetical protein